MSLCALPDTRYWITRGPLPPDRVRVKRTHDVSDLGLTAFRQLLTVLETKPLQPALAGRRSGVDEEQSWELLSETECSFGHKHYALLKGAST